MLICMFKSWWLHIWLTLLSTCQHENNSTCTEIWDMDNYNKVTLFRCHSLLIINNLHKHRWPRIQLYLKEKRVRKETMHTLHCTRQSRKNEDPSAGSNFRGSRLLKTPISISSTRWENFLNCIRIQLQTQLTPTSNMKNVNVQLRIIIYKFFLLLT